MTTRWIRCDNFVNTGSDLTLDMIRLPDLPRECRRTEEDVYEASHIFVCHKRVRPEFGIGLRMVDRAAGIVSVRDYILIRLNTEKEKELHIRFKPENIGIGPIVDPWRRIHILCPYLVNWFVSAYVRRCFYYPRDHTDLLGRTGVLCNKEYR